MIGRKKFYGSASVGERGQIVIPAEARSELGIKAGDKLIVFGMGPMGLSLMKAESLTRIVDHLAENLEELRGLTAEPAQEDEE